MQVDISVKGESDLNYYVENQDWELLDYHGEKKDYKLYFSCITFTLKLRRRRSGYTKYVFVLPAVTLALLVPIIFLMSPDCTGKFPLGTYVDSSL